MVASVVRLLGFFRSTDCHGARHGLYKSYIGNIQLCKENRPIGRYYQLGCTIGNRLYWDSWAITILAKPLSNSPIYFSLSSPKVLYL